MFIAITSVSLKIELERRNWSPCPALGAPSVSKSCALGLTRRRWVTELEYIFSADVRKKHVVFFRSQHQTDTWEKNFAWKMVKNFKRYPELITFVEEKILNSLEIQKLRIFERIFFSFNLRKFQVSVSIFFNRFFYLNFSCSLAWLENTACFLPALPRYARIWGWFDKNETF